MTSSHLGSSSTKGETDTGHKVAASIGRHRIGVNRQSSTVTEAQYLFCGVVTNGSGFEHPPLFTVVTDTGFQPMDHGHIASSHRMVNATVTKPSATVTDPRANTDGQIAYFNQVPGMSTLLNDGQLIDTDHRVTTNDRPRYYRPHTNDSQMAGVYEVGANYEIHTDGQTTDTSDQMDVAPTDQPSTVADHHSPTYTTLTNCEYFTTNHHLDGDHEVAANYEINDDGQLMDPNGHPATVATADNNQMACVHEVAANYEIDTDGQTLKVVVHHEIHTDDEMNDNEVAFFTKNAPRPHIGDRPNQTFGSPLTPGTADHQPAAATAADLAAAHTLLSLYNHGKTHSRND